MVRSENNVWLHRFALLTALATLALLAVGGLVTSKGVGMAVPDWPTSYGYNMFALPFHFWKGGVLYEHSHRLVASGVGLLTTILMVWLWLAESRRWLRWLGIAAFVAVVFQGVLGGLRVVLFKDEIGIFHATLAQLFFGLVCAIALFTSNWWVNLPALMPASQRKLGRVFLVTTVLIFLQLILGATMRHQHAGLAIPDFPLAYGKIWPATDASSIAAYNARRVEVTAANSITAFQVTLQMVHRIMALMIFAGVSVVAWRVKNGAETLNSPILRRLASVWVCLILVQIALGAWTIWSNKAADVATAHVLVGALSLVTGMAGSIICFRRLAGVAPSPVAEFSEAAAVQGASA